LGVGCGGGKMRRLDGVVVRYSGYWMTRVGGHGL
jgi:hypothetical protein